MRDRWALIDASQRLPCPPITVERWRWYARYLAWWMADPQVKVIPWQVPPPPRRHR